MTGAKVLSRPQGECPGPQDVIAIIEAQHPDIAGRVLPETTFREHGLDSLDVMSVVLDVEAAFGVSLDDRRVDAIETVGDLISAAQERFATARPRGPVDEPMTRREAEADGAAQGTGFSGHGALSALPKAAQLIRARRDFDDTQAPDAQRREAALSMAELGNAFDQGRARAFLRETARAS